MVLIFIFEDDNSNFQIQKIVENIISEYENFYRNLNVHNLFIDFFF